MAVTIPIWPGSSSFCPGETNFGYFDTETAFQLDADPVASWAAKRLGFPIVDVELQDCHFFNAFEEATTEYAYMVNAYNLRDNMLYLQGATTGSDVTQRLVSTNFERIVQLAEEYGSEAGSGGNVQHRRSFITTTASQQIYDLNDWAVNNITGSFSGSRIEIKKIYHFAPPAIVRYFDPFVGTGLGQQQLLDAFGFGNYSPGVSFLLMPVYADILRLQAIEFNDQIRRSNYSFELRNNQLKLFPIPGKSFNVYFDYILRDDRANPLKQPNGLVSDFSNANYNLIPYTYINSIGKRWIFRYMLSLCKETLGEIRSKYEDGIPLPRGTTRLNGSSLLDRAQREKEILKQELSSHLEEVSRSALLEKKKQQSDNLNSTLFKVPLPFRIG